MNWLRLYITVEGPTEKAFADQALTPRSINQGEYKLMRRN